MPERNSALRVRLTFATNSRATRMARFPLSSDALRRSGYKRLAFEALDRRPARTSIWPARIHLAPQVHTEQLSAPVPPLKTTRRLTIVRASAVVCEVRLPVGLIERKGKGKSGGSAAAL